MGIHISDWTHKFQNKTGLDAKANSELYKSKRVNSAAETAKDKGDLSSTPLRFSVPYNDTNTPRRGYWVGQPLSPLDILTVIRFLIAKHNEREIFWLVFCRKANGVSCKRSKCAVCEQWFLTVVKSFAEELLLHLNFNFTRLFHFINTYKMLIPKLRCSKKTTMTYHNQCKVGIVKSLRR
jgi:hypothetical protein